MSESEITSAPPVSGDLVVVGSSAGGVEALSTLIGKLPADFPAPIVLAQHLDPNRPSALDVILQRRTYLPVVVVHSHTSLEPGKIYVVPSNYHAAIRDGYVELQEDRDKRPSPSVDLLLSSAARVYGDRLIAVILTGSGSDGAAGAVDVKNAGGTVIVQDPKTARYPSMPLALPPTIADFEASIEQIGSLLYELLTGANLPPHEESTQDILRIILEQVSHQASIDFRPYKTTTILRRIGRRMSSTHNRSISDYARYIEKHPSETGELVKAFLINVTQFFRDPDAFVLLKKEILPKLVAQARDRDRVLRFWTAGCATGEEPYSLAMLLVDLLDTELRDWSIKIFATDIDEEAITFARQGLYSENMPKSVPVEYQERFFERVDHGYRIAKTLRQMVIFGQQNLCRSAPFPRIDMVLCRNVLIYFMPELQNYVLSQFAFSLNSNGYLFLGKAETVRPSQAYYELVNKRWKIYRCTGSVLPMLSQQNLSNLPAARLLEGGSRSGRGLGKVISSQASASMQAQTSLPELLQLRHFNELLLRFLPVGIVVIDRTYRILTFNGEARRLLGLRDAGTEQDFLHSVRGIPYPTVRQTIDLVFRERKIVTLPEVELENVMGGNGRFISFSIALMQMDAGIPDLATISVSDVTEQIQIRRQLETVQAEQAQLMNELGTANRRQNDINKELLDSNEELQVTNEELLLTHEELQATIEEFETTNEELQATNEELETSNEELQATNEELETTNQEVERLNYLKEEFLSLASHELRTPLTSILGNAELLQIIQQKQDARAGAGQEQAQEAISSRESEALIVGRIVHQAVRMGWLVDEMLDITRMRGEVFELNIKGTVDVVAVARRVVEQFETTTRRTIALETNQECISGDFDEERLEQVLNNLVSNALKYSLPTTPVAVDIELRSAEHDRPGEVIIRVQDEGVGISEEDQVRIFDRFYRVHSNKYNSAGGLGLGLYIAYEIIERQGGRMWLESSSGVGSTFYVSLPLTT